VGRRFKDVREEVKIFAMVCFVKIAAVDSLATRMDGIKNCKRRPRKDFRFVGNLYAFQCQRRAELMTYMITSSKSDAVFTDFTEGVVGSR
jgi:hypothetical protein